MRNLFLVKFWRFNLSYLAIFTFANTNALYGESLQDTEVQNFNCSNITGQINSANSQRQGYLEFLISKCPDIPELYYNLSLILINDKNYLEAIPLLEKAIKLKEQPEFFNALAEIYGTKKDYEQAEKYLSKALKIDPKNTTTLHLMSNLLIEQGDSSRAVSILKQVAEDNKNNRDLLGALAVAYEKDGNNDQAIAIYKSLLVSKNYSDVLLRRYLLLLVKTSNYQEIVNLSDIVQDLDIKEGELNLALGLAYFKQQKYDLSEMHLRKCLVQEPENLEALFLLADVLSRQNKTEEQIAIYKLIISKKPQNIKSYLQLTKILISLNRNEEAKNIVLELLSFDPTNADAHNSLGVIYWRSGKHDLAKREFSHAYRLNPQLKTAKDNLAKISSQ